MAPLSARFEDALVYANRLHAAQRRKGSGAPYISHLLGVTAIVLEYGGGEDQAIAALLHDAVEDQGGAPILAEIRARYGDDVAEIVDGCTDTDQTPKPPWRNRKELYVAHVRDAPERTRLVSAADKLYNTRAIVADHRRDGPLVWQRFSGTREDVKWYYRAVAEALREGSLGVALAALLDELDDVVVRLERLT